MFVSSCKTLDEYTGYLAKQPWLSLPYSHSAFFGVKEFLQEKLEVDGMPTVVLFDEAGEVNIADATRRVKADPTGAAFPWPPTPWTSMEDAMDDINAHPHLLAFTDNLEGEEKGEVEKSVKALLDELAAPYFKEGAPSDDMRFALAGEGRAADSVRFFCGLEGDKGLAEAKTLPRFVIIDVPSRLKCLLPAASGPRGLGLPTSEALKAFLGAYLQEGHTGLEPIHIKEDIDPDSPKEHGHSHGGEPCGGHGH